jgi:hypothetical protein
VVVPQDSYFFMGDNRDQSFDGRFWGFVPLDALRGKAFIIYFSWEGTNHEPIYLAFLGGLRGLITHHAWDAGSFKLRWQRIGKPIH